MALATVIAGVGLAVSAGGLAMNYSNSRSASAANARAAAAQAEISRIQAQQVNTEEAKLRLQSDQQRLQIDTQRSVIRAQQEAEDIRMRASVLDATRRRREVIRQSIVARSNSLAVATAQGAASRGSTAVAQAGADISGRTGVNLLGISQNLEFGQRLFDINRSISNMYLQAQDDNETFVTRSEELQRETLGRQRQIYQLGGEASNSYREAANFQSMANLGAGLSSLGGSLVSNAQTIGRIGTYFTTPTATPATSYGGFVSGIGSNGIY